MSNRRVYPERSRRGFALPLTILVLILVIIVGVYFGLKKYGIGNLLQSNHLPKGTDVASDIPPNKFGASPSPIKNSDETVYTDKGSANWKTYQDDKYSFEYPTNLRINKINTRDRGGVEINRIEILNEQNISVIDISLDYNAPGAPPPCIPELNCRTENIKPLNTGNTITIYIREDFNYAEADIVKKNGRTVNFGLKVLTEENLKIFRQILSTFRFTNESELSP